MLLPYLVAPWPFRNVVLLGLASCWVVHDKCICCSCLALWGCIWF